MWEWMGRQCMGAWIHVTATHSTMTRSARCEENHHVEYTSSWQSSEYHKFFFPFAVSSVFPSGPLSVWTWEFLVGGGEVGGWFVDGEEGGRSLAVHLGCVWGGGQHGKILVDVCLSWGG